MQVARINASNYSTSFNARFKVDPAVTEKLADTLSGPCTLSSSTGGVSSLSATASGVTTAASGSDILASAFSLQASGVNSSGIVPAYLKSAANSSLMPDFLVNGSQAHPSIAGSMFSTLGSWLHSANAAIKIKDPS